jgi:type IV secretory pathway VirB4 component
MAKDWKNELKEIITSNQKTIKQVVEDRDNREKERLKKIKEIKNYIKPRMEFIRELFEKDDFLKSEVEKQKEKTGGNTNTISQTQPYSTQDIIESEFIDSARRGADVSIPTIKEDMAEIALIMPVLSDVNRLDLMYKIEFKGEKPVLHSYNLLSQGKMENNGSAHDKYEDFIQDTMKRFLLSWFRRKEGTERDKERKFEIHIISHGLKP